MKIICRKCGWNRDVPLTEFEIIVRLGKIECSRCGYIHYLLEELIPCEMQYPYFISEWEVQCVVMNALFKRGATVWQCPAEIGLCKDPIMLDNVPFGILVGDFPFYWDNVFRDMEMKFAYRTCRMRKEGKDYSPRIEIPKLLEPQWKMLLQGGGLLLYVIEPPITKIGVNAIKSPIKRECQRQLHQEYHLALGESRIPYEVFLLDHLLFRKYWNKYLHAKKTDTIIEKEKPILYKMLGFNEMRQYVPEAQHYVTMNDFQNGNLADLIMKLVENRGR